MKFILLILKLLVVDASFPIYLMVKSLFFWLQDAIYGTTPVKTSPKSAILEVIMGDYGSWDVMGYNGYKTFNP